MYSKSPDLQGAVYDVCDVGQQACRGDMHLWCQMAMLGRSLCLRLENLGCNRGRDLIVRVREKKTIQLSLSDQ
jgi:hypothetical protein